MAKQHSIAASPRGEHWPYLPELAIAANVLIWSSTPVIIKDLYSHITPLAFTALRFIVTIVVAALALWWYRRREGGSIAIAAGDRLRLIACGLTGFTGFQLGFILGLDRTTAFATAILGSLTPIFALVLLTFMGERSPWIVWLGVLVAFIGAAVFIAANGGGGSGTLLGNLLIAGSSMVFALYTIISRPLTKKYSPHVFTFWALLIGSIPIWVIGAPATIEQEWSGIPLRIWLSFLYLSIFPVYLAYHFWNYGVRRRGVPTMSAYSLLVPVLGGIWAWFLLNEEITGLKLFGGALVLIGLIVMRRTP